MYLLCYISETHWTRTIIFFIKKINFSFYLEADGSPIQSPTNQTTKFFPVPPAEVTASQPPTNTTSPSINTTSNNASKPPEAVTTTAVTCPGVTPSSTSTKSQTEINAYAKGETDDLERRSRTRRMSSRQVRLQHNVSVKGNFEIVIIYLIFVYEKLLSKNGLFC